MGLREILTKPIGFGASRFQWREPLAFRIRLRGDAWLRGGVVLGSWGFGTGALSLLFVENVHRPGPALAIGLGTLFGLLAATLVFFLRDHVSGRVYVDAGEIRRYRSYAGILPSAWSEWQHWPCDAIDSIVVTPASAIEMPFSLLVLTVNSERELIGVPSSIDLSVLTRFLAAQGVKVTSSKIVPHAYRTRLNTAVASIVPVAGGIMLVIGMSWLLSARGGLAGNRLAEREPPDLPLLAEDDHELESVRHSGKLVSQMVPEQAAASSPGQHTPPPSFPTPGFRGPGIPGASSGILRPQSVQSPSTGQSQKQAASPGKAPPEESPGVSEHHVNFRKTSLIGAPGGFDFQRSNPRGLPVIGFRSTFGTWDGKAWVSRFEPLYEGDRPVPGWQSVLAKPGYAVAALLVDAPEFVNAYAVIFQRLTPEGMLDPDDSYTSDWVGPKSDTTEQLISGEGNKVLGIHGRAGAILNAIGLLIESE